MKSIKYQFLFCTCFFLGLRASAAEILRLELAPSMSYETLSTDCTDHAPSSLPPRTLVFSAEVDGTKVKIARLSTSMMDVSCYLKPFPGYTPAHNFSEEDTKDIELFLDDKKKSWLKTLPLTTNQLQWLFSNKEGCKPTQELVTMSPIPFIVNFKVNGAGQSEPTSIYGRDKNGDFYKATFIFEQRRINRGQNG